MELMLQATACDCRRLIQPPIFADGIAAWLLALFSWALSPVR
jgi:hypothetical protein